jgi:hypothetical protein
MVLFLLCFQDFIFFDLYKKLELQMNKYMKEHMDIECDLLI